MDAPADVTIPTREWWLRTLAVLQAPRAVFAALRDDTDEEARQEPLLAIVWLAGIAGVLMTNQTARLLDDFAVDALLVAVLVFLTGGIYGIAGYFLLGALARIGERVVSGDGSYRRARHVVGFAAVPLVLSLLLWPIRLAAFGGDSFRSGGADSGLGGSVFEALELVAIAWALALVPIGFRALHGRGWAPALAASAPVVLLASLVLARAHGLV